MNYNAYNLESSRLPSCVSSSLEGIKSSVGSVSALEGTEVKSTTVTKTETVVIRTEDKKKEEETEDEQKTGAEESEAVEKKEQEEAQAVAEE